jgi:hypothetical protein
MTNPDSSGPPTLDRQEQNDRRAAVRDFVVELVKLLSHTAIYTSDHPVVKRAVERPFRLFAELPLAHDELTFLTEFTSGEHAELFVEGGTDETTPLGVVLRSSMGEHFQGKLRTYLERNRIVNLSIKRGIGHDEFANFVAVMVRRNPDVASDWSGASFDFSAELAREGVAHVSVVMWDDLAGAERRLPWRVRMAVARLRKDLRNLPLYQKASGKELLDAKRQIVTDIIRPLTRPEFIRDLLINVDLVARGTSELDAYALEDDISACLSDGLVVPVMWEIVREIERLDKAKMGERDRMTRESDLQRGLKKLALRAVTRDDRKAYDTLRQLFDRGILQFQQLPDDLKRAVLRESWTDHFLKNPEANLRRFEAEESLEVVHRYLDSFVVIFPELLERQKYKELVAVAGVLRARRTIRGFEPLYQEHRKELFSAEFLQSLEKAVQSSRKGDRQALLGMLDLFGVEAVPYLVQALSNATEATVRRGVCDALVRLGRDAVPGLVAELNARAYEWFVARNLVMVLGEIADEAAVAALQRFMGHPNTRVREEALGAFTRIRGEQAEPYLLEHLGEHVPSVRRRALQCLASIGSHHARFLGELETGLDDFTRQDAGTPPEVQQACLRCALDLGNLALPSGRTLLDVLHGFIAPLTGMERLKSLGLSVGVRLGRGRKELSQEGLIEVLRGLAGVGDRTSLRAMLPLLRDERPLVSEAARNASREIESRLAGAAPQVTQD